MEIVITTEPEITNPPASVRTEIAALWFASPAISTWTPIVCSVSGSSLTSVIESAFCAAATRTESSSTSSASLMTLRYTPTSRATSSAQPRHKV